MNWYVPDYTNYLPEIAIVFIFVFVILLTPLAYFVFFYNDKYYTEPISIICENHE